MDEEEILQSIVLVADANYIEYRLQEDDTLVYKTQINYFEENSGMTINNVTYPVQGYYIYLQNTFGKTLKCGNIIDNFFTMLKSKVENTLIIIDFDGIQEVSDNFCSEYCKHLLSTNNKIITINQDINISNIFANFVATNFIDIETENPIYVTQAEEQRIAKELYPDDN